MKKLVCILFFIISADMFYAQIDTIRLQLPEFVKYIFLNGDTARSTNCYDKKGKKIYVYNNKSNIDSVYKCDCNLVLRRKVFVYNSGDTSFFIKEEKIKQLSTYERLNKTTWKETDFTKDSPIVSKKVEIPNTILSQDTMMSQNINTGNWVVIITDYYKIKKK